MNREETLALYEQGVEAWNKWANEMLEERKRLEEAGEWEERKNNWIILASANFSTLENSHIFTTNFDVSEYIFPSKLLLDNATFDTDVNFSKCVFKEEAIFNNSKFNKGANFKNTIFESCAEFLDVYFHDIPKFKKAIFKSSAYFDHSEFNSSAWFSKVVFEGETYFYKCKFNDFAYFDSTKFEYDTFFNNVSFNSDNSFKKVEFFGEVTFKSAHFKENAEFDQSKFYSKIDFVGIHCEKGFSLENVEFLIDPYLETTPPPNFIQANFKEAPRLDNIEIAKNILPGKFLNSITTHIPTETKARYQALKRLAIQAHDHENEQRFWAGELRSDRSLRTEDGGWNLRPLYSAFWWGNIAYGCVSDYGRSIVRPIGALLILICLMTGLHLTKSKTPLTYNKAFSAGYIAANKSFLYLGTDPTKRSIIKEKYSALYGANENQTPKIPKTILTAEFFQTLLSAIFIFLALLGIRNNFKMK